MNPLLAVALVLELPGLVVGFGLGVTAVYVFVVLQNWGWIK